METKIPPPIVTLIFIFLIAFSNRIVEPFSSEFQMPLGVAIIICGLAVLILAVRVFKQLETTINPMQPSQASKLAIALKVIGLMNAQFAIKDNEIKKVRIYPQKSKSLNLAFDVTPAKLVTGLITEKGVCEASEKGLKGLFK